MVLVYGKRHHKAKKQPQTKSSLSLRIDIKAIRLEKQNPNFLPSFCQSQPKIETFSRSISKKYFCVVCNLVAMQTSVFSFQCRHWYVLQAYNSFRLLPLKTNFLCFSDGWKPTFYTNSQVFTYIYIYVNQCLMFWLEDQGRGWLFFFLFPFGKFHQTKSKETFDIGS